GWDATTIPFRVTSVWIVGVFSSALFLWKPLRQIIDSWALLAIAIAAISWLFGVSLYPGQTFRQFVGMAALLTIISAVGLGGCTSLLAKLIARAKIPRINRTYWATGITVAIVALSLIPTIRDAIGLATDHTFLDYRNDLTAWADKTL